MRARSARTEKRTRNATLAVAGNLRAWIEALRKRPEDGVVLIEELDPDDWGPDGVTATELRRRRAAAE